MIDRVYTEERGERVTGKQREVGLRSVYRCRTVFVNHNLVVKELLI